MTCTSSLPLMRLRGAGGDALQVLQGAVGNDDYDWYRVAFESGAEGWVRSDLVQLSE